MKFEINFPTFETAFHFQELIFENDKIKFSRFEINFPTFETAFHFQELIFENDSRLRKALFETVFIAK
jgi:hypothetical protein